ncbi:MAG: hypothetical protein ACTHMD_01380 [Flavisolibacter sp.]
MNLKSRHTRAQERIRSNLKLLYPRINSKEVTEMVLSKINNCTTSSELYTLLFRKNFEYDLQLQEAFSKKFIEIKGYPNALFFAPPKQSHMRQLTIEERKGFITIIKALIPGMKKKERISVELQEAIAECSTAQQLTDLLYSMEINKEAEIDAFEIRYNQLLRA